MRDSMTRRQAILGTGALAVATTSSIAVFSKNSGATATVNGTFQIPDGETVLADTQLEDVELEVDATYGYEANAPIHRVDLELHVGATPDTLDLIARHERPDLGTDQLNGEATLRGSLVNASDFTMSDFQPTNGELRTTVVAELRLYVSRRDEVVAEAVETTTFEVRVREEELTVDTNVSGSGEVVFETG